MSYFKNTESQVFWLDATDVAEWKKPDWSPITDAEAEALRNPPRSIEARRAAMACSPRQIRQALTVAGLRAAIESAVAAGDQNLKDWWEFATAFDRLHPQVVAMGAVIGKTPEEVDAVFELAATL